MPVIYKCDVLLSLKEKGITSYKMRKDKIMGERTIQQLRDGQLVSWDNIAKICDLLGCQPGDILAYVTDSRTFSFSEGESFPDLKGDPSYEQP